MERLDGVLGDESVNLNVGSGQRPFPKPWINIDIQERWKPDIVADWRNLGMFEDGTADYIVAHQTIEHVGCGEAKPFFLEAHRILKDGGSLIITVPDLRALAQRWLTHQISDYIYIVNLMGAYMNEESDRHRWHHTFPSLHEDLTRLQLDNTVSMDDGPLLGERERYIGFSDVKYFDWRPIEGADIAKDFWILGVEAIK